jgi:N-acetylmuramic acid 6-phosphate etherase
MSKMTHNEDVEKNQASFILGIDGGATSSKAACVAEDGRTLAKAKADSCNVVLRSDAEMLKIFQSIHKDTTRGREKNLLGVALCLAGVIDDYHKNRVFRVARRVWKKVPIWITDDLVSALYAGLGHGNGIVVISGTGASVYGSFKGREARAGGWGHVLGDAGSAYYIAHRALRWAIAHYDSSMALDKLCRALLRKAQLKSIEELTTFVSLADKKTLAGLSEAVFVAAKEGHRGAQGVINGAVKALARNTAIVKNRLSGSDVPICVSGGVFRSQDLFFKLFKRALRELVPNAQPKRAVEDGGVGAALWGWEELGAPIHKARPAENRKGAQPASAPLTLKDIEKSVRLDDLPTENSNPKSAKLSSLPLRDAIRLFIEEDRHYLFPALEAEVGRIEKAIQMVSDAFLKGGRLFYVGAGTSGRLGILDASECPPTFRTSPNQVQGIIAGGFEALLTPVEHAEDRFKDGQRAVRAKGLRSEDVVCGISASGRTPFVLGALSEGSVKKSKTILIRCHDKDLESSDLPSDCLVIALDTGPEVLTGSTRLRAGTATKMVLNMISTLSMIGLGKISGNYMIDLKPTNYKLMARAIRIVQELKGITKEEAFARLSEAQWQLKKALV